MYCSVEVLGPRADGHPTKDHAVTSAPGVLHPIDSAISWRQCLEINNVGVDDSIRISLKVGIRIHSLATYPR
jgi:hypothetical protein